jgi:hypothetical protein
LHTEKEEDEAHLMVPSERRGELGSGGAMVRMVMAVFSSFVHREEKRKVGRRGDSGGARKERWRRLGFSLGIKREEQVEVGARHGGGGPGHSRCSRAPLWR